MDRTGCPPAGCHRVDDRLRTGHDVAAGEDARSARGDVRGSATMPAQPLISMPAPAGRIDGSGSSPIATRIVAAGMSSDRCPGPARRRHDRRPSRSARRWRMHSQRGHRRPRHRGRPPVTAAVDGSRCLRVRAASTSSVWAGISARPRRYRTVTRSAPLRSGGTGRVHRRAAAADDDDRTAQAGAPRRG